MNETQNVKIFIIILWFRSSGIKFTFWKSVFTSW